MYQTPQLPHSPPFVVQAGVSPQFQQYLPLATGYAMQLAMQNANISPLRQAFVSQLSQNNWQNPVFEQLAKMTAQFAEYISQTRRYEPTAAIRYAVDKLLHCLTAAFVSSNSNMFPQLRDPNVVNAMQGHLRELNEITNQVNGFYTQMQQPQMQPQMNMGYQPPMPVRQGGMGQMGGYVQQTPMARSNNMFQPNNGYNVQQPQFNQIQTLTRTTGFDTNVQQPNGVVYERATERQTQTTGIEESFTMNPTPAISLAQVNKIKVNATPAQTDQWQSLGDSTWPKVLDPQRPWDAVLLENGSEIRPAAISGWTISKDRQAYSLAFDPSIHIKFHVRSPDGSIQETLLNWEDTMDYLAHELDLEAARKYAKSKQRNENIVFDSIQIVQINPDNNAPEEKDPITEALFGQAVNHRIVHGALLTNNFKEARRLLEIKIDGLEAFDVTQPYEYTVDIIKDLLIYTDDQPHTESIANAKDFNTVLSSYGDLGDELVKEFINERLCKRVNFELNNRLGVGWTISDIVTDYLDLLNELKMSYGESIAERLDDRFERIIQHALPAIDLNALEESDLKQVCMLKGYQPEDIAKTSMAVSFFTLRSSVTVLPYTYQELGLELSEQEPRLLEADKYKRLHSDLSAILDRNASIPYPIQHRYVQFKDNKIVEVMNGLLINDSVLLRLAQLEE